MTPEQLASARAAHWREDAQPLLRLDDAKAWLERMQLCLYLPRKTHVLAPAPSFVGAVLGSSSATPPPETIQHANELLVRLVAEGFVVPLNLFGTPGEQPDFLILTSALPHLAALQADRNWKKAPTRTGPGKVSPLAIEVWKLLDREGALTANEIRDQLGHELTEAATIRALTELWQNLRVAPLPQAGGEPANWEILSVTHKKEMAAGGTLAQSTALSLLVSYYLQSVLAGTAEDIEAFLSPVASRTRLRDVIRGLSATRQLRTLSMDAQTFLFIEGSLPDTSSAPVSEAPATDKPAFMGRSAYRERMLNKVKEADTPKQEDTSPRTYKERRGDASSDKPRRTFSERPRSGPPASRPSRFAAGSGARPARPSFSDRARPSFERPDRPSRPSPDRPFRPRPTADRGNATARPFRPRPDGDQPATARPTQDRPMQNRPMTDGPRQDRPRTGRPFAPREGARPTFERSRPSFRDKPAAGEGRTFRPRPDGDRPAGRPPFRGKTADAGARPFRPRPEGDRPRSDRPFRKSTSEGRPFTPRPSAGREGGARPPFRGKPAEGGARPFRGKPPASGARPYRPRPEGDKPPYPRRENSGSPSRPAGRPTDRPASRFGAGSARPPRPAGGFIKRDGPPTRSPGRSASSGRPGAPGRNPGGTGRPGGSKFGPPRAGSRPTSRPGARPGASRPSGPRASGPRPPRPSGSRPGGMRPPTRKPRKPESDSE